MKLENEEIRIIQSRGHGLNRFWSKCAWSPMPRLSNCGFEQTVEVGGDQSSVVGFRDQFMRGGRLGRLAKMVAQEGGILACAERRPSEIRQSEVVVLFVRTLRGPRSSRKGPFWLLRPASLRAQPTWDIQPWMTARTRRTAYTSGPGPLLARDQVDS